MAKVIACTEPTKWREVNYSTTETIMAVLKRQDGQLQELEEISRQVDLKKTCVGVVLFFSVADSYAVYCVVKDRPLTLEHIPYGDAWHADARLLRGLRRQDILEEEMRARALAKMLAKK